MEQWGATQLQNRFVKRFSRRMQALDMQAWTAVRMIGEAVTRTKSAQAQQVREFILGPSFELAAFKGQALTVRPWNLQLRQPVLLSDGKNVVSRLPAAWLSAPRIGTRYARLRQTGNKMRIEMTSGRGEAQARNIRTGWRIALRGSPLTLSLSRGRGNGVVRSERYSGVPSPTGRGTG